MSKSKRTMTSQVLGEGAYKGYLIRTSQFSREWWIDQLIGYAKSATDARTIIDALTVAR